MRVGALVLLALLGCLLWYLFGDAGGADRAQTSPQVSWDSPQSMRANPLPRSEGTAEKDATGSRHAPEPVRGGRSAPHAFHFRVEGEVHGLESATGDEFEIQVRQSWDGALVHREVVGVGPFQFDFAPTPWRSALSVLIQLNRVGDEARVFARDRHVLRLGVAERVVFDARPSPSIRGRVLASDGTPLPRLQLAAVPWESLVEPGARGLLHPHAVTGATASSTTTDRTGYFELRGLEESGTYRVMSLSHAYYLRDPVRLSSGTRDIELRATKSATVSIRATDAESGAAIPEFELRSPAFGQAVLRGREGEIKARVARPQAFLRSEWGGMTAQARLEAPGYRGQDVKLWWGPEWGGRAVEVALDRIRVPNLEIDVRRSDGTSFDGDVSALSARREERAKRALPLARDRRGVLLGALAPGRYWVAIWPSDGAALVMKTYEVEVRAGEVKKLSVVVPPSGSLRIATPPGAWRLHLGRDGWFPHRPPGGFARTPDVTLRDTVFFKGDKAVVVGPVEEGRWTATLFQQGKRVWQGPVEIRNGATEAIVIDD
ncbi:MAG: hypothetical protein AAGD14_00560 [Planctomycetota bacterium]